MKRDGEQVLVLERVISAWHQPIRLDITGFSSCLCEVQVDMSIEEVSTPHRGV